MSNNRKNNEILRVSICKSLVFDSTIRGKERRRKERIRSTRKVFLLFHLFCGVCVQFNQGSKDQEPNQTRRGVL